MPTFGENVKRYRTQRGMTQAELAKRLGYRTKSSVSKIETDVAEIPQSVIQKIADILDVSVSSLFSDVCPVYNKETGMLTIPFISQKLSAGFGEEELPDESLEVKTVDIFATMIRDSVDKKSLVCARAKGDSMIGASIFSGDFVIFARGLISGEGLYVIVLYDEVMVKRVSFDAPADTLTIISENDKYPVRTVNAENVRILGKVVGWIHSEPV